MKRVTTKNCIPEVEKSLDGGRAQKKSAYFTFPQYLTPRKLGEAVDP